jgi:hypothetical protein
MNANIVSNTTTSGSILDTAQYDLGVMFEFASPVYTDGTFTPTLLQSDDPAMVGATVVPAENLIGTYAGAVVNAVTPALGILATLGIFGTLRYIQVQEVSTVVTTGARIVINAINKAEILPVIDTLGS